MSGLRLSPVAAEGDAALSDDDLTRFLAQVGHSLEMIEALPALVGSAAVPAQARDACAEAFYVHANFLGQFLLSSPRKDGDVVASDYVPHWELDRQTAKRLRSLCDFAAAHVLRPSRGRLDEPVVDVDGAILRSEGCRLVEACRRFVTQLRFTGRDEDAGVMDGFLPAPE